MQEIKVLIDEEKINNRITELANQIHDEFGDEEIILVCVLKGATYFTVDLSKKINSDNVLIDFVKAKSYGIGQRETSGEIDFQLDLSENVEGRNVVIVEDIIDSGITMKYLVEHISAKKPKTLKICALLDKPSRRTEDIYIDYVGFTIDNLFVLGYGMDCDEKYRNLPYIGYVE
ncbi:MAG: hypoxanthine phosphoribosyltransferase [Clostridia bacterium]|nr:hypoxanthine phosphoribosyltransferase [Clostridia bacterium]